MEKYKVRDHSSVVILPSQNGNEFVFNVYDATYPRVEFRGAVNLVGGNLDPTDSSPRQLLERKLNEEFRIDLKGDSEMEKSLVGGLLVLDQEQLYNLLQPNLKLIP